MFHVEHFFRRGEKSYIEQPEGILAGYIKQLLRINIFNLCGFLGYVLNHAACTPLASVRDGCHIWAVCFKEKSFGRDNFQSGECLFSIFEGKHARETYIHIEFKDFKGGFGRTAETVYNTPWLVGL